MASTTTENNSTPVSFESFMGTAAPATPAKPNIDALSGWYRTVTATDGADAEEGAAISKNEWERLSEFGINARKARRAYRKGAAYWQDFARKNVLPKFDTNYYIDKDNSGKIKLFRQGEQGYNPKRFASATYKGTDPAAVTKAYNSALEAARKSAQLRYDPEKDAYYATYTVGNFDVEDADVTNSNWIDNARKKALTAEAYRDAVDNYTQDSEGNAWNPANLLNTVGYSESVDDFDSKTDADKNKIKSGIQTAIYNYYYNLARNAQGHLNWNDSVKADAWLKKMKSYWDANPKPYLAPISISSSMYERNPATGETSTSSVRGSAIGFSYKKGGNLKQRILIKKAGWGTQLVQAIKAYPSTLWGNIKNHPFIWGSLATLLGGTQTVSHCSQKMADPNPVSDNSDNEVEYRDTIYFTPDGGGSYFKYHKRSSPDEDVWNSNKKEFEAAKKQSEPKIKKNK